MSGPLNTFTASAQNDVRSRVTDEARTNFQQFGSSFHLKIRDAADLHQALELDESHWVATSAPVSSLNFDSTFISLLDPDQSGRIICDEIRGAIRWIFDVLKDPSGLSAGSDSLAISAISTGHKAGKDVHRSATKLLRQLNKPDADTITLSQVRAIKSKIEAQPVSEAGVMLPSATDDADLRQFIESIVSVIGGVDHPSGDKGVNGQQLDAFLDRTKEYLAWQEKGALDENEARSDVQPLGSQTSEAYLVFRRMRNKVDQYFSQCRAIRFDPRTAQRFMPSVEKLESLDLGNPAAINAMMEAGPLAEPKAECLLVASATFNPCYAMDVEPLFLTVIEPILGFRSDPLSEREWQTIKKAFEVHAGWVDAKPSGKIGSIDANKLKRYSDDGYASAIRQRIAESHETAVEMNNIRLTEKAILIQANLLKLLNNYVSFPDLYDPHSRAMFEMGTLIMDGRRFTFTVKVHDRKRHSELAETSLIYVLYAKIFTGSESTDYEIAAPVTAGGKGNLCMGKRGVFIDIEGNQFDAQIVQIIENPISLCEAIVSPYQRFGRILSGKIESITSASEKQFDEQAGRALESPQISQPAAQQQTSALPAGGMLLGGGVAVAALSSAAAYVTNTIANIGPGKIIVTLIIAALAVVIPTSAMAIWKLRSRDLSAILEGSGWAINARMRLTFRQANVFTERPMRPGELQTRKKQLKVLICIAAGLLVVLFLLIAFLDVPEGRTNQATIESDAAVQESAPTPTTLLHSPVQAPL